MAYSDVLNGSLDILKQNTHYLNETARALMMLKFKVRQFITVKSVTGVTGSKIPFFSHIDGVDKHTYGSAATEREIHVMNRLITLNDFDVTALSFDRKQLKELDISVLEKSMGRLTDAFASHMETLALNEILLTSLMSGTVDGVKLSEDGTSIVAPLIRTATTTEGKADALLSALINAHSSMEEKKEYGEKVVFMSPTNYNLLVQSKAIHQWYTTSTNGGLNSGVINEVFGMKIVKSNFMPTTQQTINGAKKDPIALVFTKDAIGMLELEPITIETEEEKIKVRYHVIGSSCQGFGGLNPAGACCVYTDPAP